DADVGVVRRVLLVGEFPQDGAAVHQGTAAHGDERRASSEHASRRFAARLVAGVFGPARVDGGVLRDCTEDLPLALTRTNTDTARTDTARLLCPCRSVLCRYESVL